MMRALFFALLITMAISACNQDAFEQRREKQAALIPPATQKPPAPVSLSETTKANLESGEISGTGAAGPATTVPPIIVKGTGVFARQPTAAAIATVTPGGDITLNFVDADIKEVIKGILGDILHVNYV